MTAKETIKQINELPESEWLRMKEHMDKKFPWKQEMFQNRTALKMWECFLFTLKEKFYPFKSRLDREKIFKQLVKPHSPT